jgi:hypothetical protein
MLNVLQAGRLHADRQVSEFCGHQQYRKHFVDARVAAVDLTIVDRIRLHELLEHDAVVTMFASGNAYRDNSFADGGVSERHLDLSAPRSQRLELSQRHPFDRLGHIPDLVGVHH